MVALQKIILSSANRRCEIWGALLHTKIPLILPIPISFCNMADKPSAHSKKRYRDIGLPCRNPVVDVILPFSSSLMRTENYYVLTHILEREIHLSWKPSFLIIASRYAHSTIKRLTYIEFYCHQTLFSCLFLNFVAHGLKSN